ncbi:hypothetical protein [Curtobacterium sp. MCBA15_008]|uniref:hypothetical protein n=1 Tax=Curtobacterium sp. MCBA15_008 TaxID=1898736 RepID=UPI001587F6EA|nr:hypothetical protein [Curtobacterium sp. MCBA15_008]
MSDFQEESESNFSEVVSNFTGILSVKDVILPHVSTDDLQAELDRRQREDES